jgi:hypothetical protein
MTAVLISLPNHIAKPRRRQTAMWVLVGVLGLLSTNSYALDPFTPPALEATQVAPRDVVGDLGGVPVTIPRHFANYVEYEGDPGWGEKRQGPRPPRTHQSKLISFGYYTRFPDMAGESAPELRKDKASYPASKTPWIDVGINTGKNYPGDGFLDRRTAQIGKSKEVLKHENYAQLSNLQHGLTVYAAAGTDPKTGTPYRESRYARDLFVHRDKMGRVDAYIDCSNRNVPAPPCRHDFSLEPHMKAQVYVQYRRSQIENWHEIQEAVTRQVLGFKKLSVEIAPTKP